MRKGNSKSDDTNRPGIQTNLRERINPGFHLRFCFSWRCQQLHSVILKTGSLIPCRAMGDTRKVGRNVMCLPRRCQSPKRWTSRSLLCNLYRWSALFPMVSYRFTGNTPDASFTPHPAGWLRWCIPAGIERRGQQLVDGEVLGEAAEVVYVATLRACCGHRRF